MYRGAAQGNDAGTSIKLVHAMLFGGATGFVVGGTRGVFNEPRNEVSASWKNATGQSWRMAGKEAALFAAVGAVFVGGSAIAEQARGKEDMYNRMYGACAAGTVAGARTGSAMTTVLACPLFAFASACVDMSEGRLKPPASILQAKHPHLGSSETGAGGH